MVASVAALPCRGWLAFHSPHRLRPVVRRARSCVASASADAQQHEQFLRRVGVEALNSLPALLGVLQAQGQTLVSPEDRQGLHPLAVPLSRTAPPADYKHIAVTSGEDVYTCLMVRKEGGRQFLVRMSRDAPSVELLARTTDEFMHRALAEEDSEGGGPGPVAEAAGATGAALYQSGTLQQSRMPLVVYLSRKAGMFPDVAEQLVAKHLAKDDMMSALITSDWYTRDDHFPGWGFPYEFNAQMYHNVERFKESRDHARTALRLPWWSFATGFKHVCELAELSGDAAALRSALDDSKVARTLPQGVRGVSLTPAELAGIEAQYIMNRVAAGEAKWDEIRGDLSEQYAQAGNSVNAALVTAGV